MIQAGSIILVDFMQSDGILKKRPALVLRVLPPFGDLLIAGITTQLHQEIRGLDIPLPGNDPAFGRTGLLRSSLLRITMLTRIAANDHRISGAIGAIEPLLLRQAQDRLADLVRGSQ